MGHPYQLLGDPSPSDPGKKQRRVWGAVAAAAGTGLAVIGFLFYLYSYFHSPSLPPLRILCLGDSLTDGTISMGALPNHPYAIQLRKTLQAGLPEREVVVVNDGLSGDFVWPEWGSYGTRLTGQIKASSHHPFDIILILGGTNDLSRSDLPAALLFRELKILYRQSLGASPGTKVIGMTVPEMRDSSEEHTQRRDEVNGMIRGFGEERFEVFDLHERIPYHGMGEKERGEVWSDGIHLSRVGYDRLGGMLGEMILGLV